MPRVALGTYLVRYPLGGMMSHVIHYAVGFRQLGCDVWLVEKAGHPNACFDVERGLMTDDCAYGARVVSATLDRFGLGDRWCYVDARGEYHGMSERVTAEVLRNADLFVDYGAHGTWDAESQRATARVLIDGEPGYNQIRMELALAAGETLVEYDAYFTAGPNVSTPRSPAPSAGQRWRGIYHPVV